MLTATITPATAGNVQFKDGPTDLVTVPVENGTAMAPVQTSMLSVSTHLLTAVFTPTAAGSPSAMSMPVSLEVKAPTEAMTTREKTILTEATGTVDPLPTPKVALAGTLTEADDGKPVVGRMIKFYGGEQLLCQATTDASGLAQCSAAENLGTQTVEELTDGYDAVFSGDEAYVESKQHMSATVGVAPPKP